MILIIGNLDKKGNNISGQTARAREVSFLISDIYPQEKIIEIDISNNSLNFIGLPILLYTSNKIFIIGARNFIERVGNFLNALGLMKKCHVVPTGGWLRDLYTNSRFLFLNKASTVYIQSEKLCTTLNKYFGSQHFKHLPNFRRNYTHFPEKNKISFKVIFNSRISEDKGIFEAVTAVQTFNEQNTQQIGLDIYGQFRNTQIERQLTRKIKNLEKINYQGIYKESEALHVIHRYDLVLFPSYYDGEGVPGSLLDAIFAGVPAIATDWNYNSEIVTNNFNGFLVPIKDANSIVQRLTSYYSNDRLVFQHSKNALTKSKKFTYQETLKKFLI